MWHESLRRLALAAGMTGGNLLGCLGAVMAVLLLGMSAGVAVSFLVIAAGSCCGAALMYHLLDTSTLPPARAVIGWAWASLVVAFVALRLLHVSIFDHDVINEEALIAAIAASSVGGLGAFWPSRVT